MAATTGSAHTQSRAEAGLTLTGAHVVTPQGVVDGWVRVDGPVIAEVGTGPAPPGRTIDLDGGWVVPGFVDIHCHGGGGASFASLDQDQAGVAVRAHRRHGTTTVLASLVTAALPELTTQIGALSDLVTDGLIAGVHLEGPFLSHARCGAHDTSALRPPDPDSVRQLLTAGPDAIRMVTLAPELDHAVSAVQRFTGSGVIAAVGHTDAVHDQVLPAIDAGATIATHLFNGMRPLHHREPGPIGALLDDERVGVEIIADLVHLHPTVLHLSARHAGPARTVAITDAISATDAGDGTYRLGNLPVTVEAGEPRLADGSLAGSTLTMDSALRNLVRACGLTMSEAVSATSATPARILGVDDRVGAIRSGLDADLVVLDADLHVRHVMKAGSWVPDPTA